MIQQDIAPKPASTADSGVDRGRIAAVLLFAGESGSKPG